MSEDVADRLLAAHAARDWDGLRRCYAADATVWPTGWPEPVPAEEWVRSVPVVLESFPDLTFHPVRTAVDGAVVVLELRMTGTNLGPLHLNDTDRRVLGTTAASVPATGRSIDVDGVVVLSLRDGVVAQERHYWLTADTMAQLVPTPV